MNVVDTIRTPFGRYGGALAKVRPDGLAAHLLREELASRDDFDPATAAAAMFEGSV